MPLEIVRLELTATIFNKHYQGHAMEEQERESSAETISLTPAQRAKVERNRQKALLLRQSKVISRNDKDVGSCTYITRAQCINTGGGFFIEDEDEPITDSPPKKQKIFEQPAPLEEVLLCVACEREFQDSYLFNNFDEAVCDNCKKNNDKYDLMTRTRAKEEYLLKDADLDKRLPLLKFILKRNPHNQRWGDMKLYLTCQVHARAMEVWGNEEAMEKQRELKELNKDKSKQKKFDKKIKELRNAVRSSLWRKDLGNHEHTYGEETYTEDTDMYSKTCTECGHELTYEKM